MSIVLRFVGKDSYVQERFFGLIHVEDTAVLTLKKNICTILSNYNIDVQSIRGQGYDGASNMRGEWNGLQEFLDKIALAFVQIDQNDFRRTFERVRENIWYRVEQEHDL